MATIALAATLETGCSGPVEETGRGYDLVALADLATVRQETCLIELGTAQARPYLEDGWSWDEPGFVWGVGKRSTVRFFLVEARELHLVLRGAGKASYGGEPQTVSVAANDSPIGKLELESTTREYRLALPAPTLRSGWNRLELGYSHWQHGPRIRQLAVKWEQFAFGEGAAPGAVPRADTGEETLDLPAGTQLEYYLRLPAASTIEVAEILAERDGDARLEILLQPEGAVEAPLATLRPGADLQVRMELAAPGVAQLVLRSVGATPTSGLTLKRPRVEPAASEMPRRTPEPRPDVIVYLIDALRADRVGAYGHQGSLTPNIDEFAADALLFEEAMAQTSWTKPAVVSLFTGMLPPAHGVLLREHALSPRATTLAEILLADGYRTAAFSTNPFVSRSFGLDQGFLDFVYLDAGRGATHHAYSDQVNKEVFDWLDEQSGGPFFLYVHTIDPHAPYTPPLPGGGYGGGEEPVPVPSCREQQPMSDEARRHLIERYEREVAFNDASFGQFVATLRARGLYDESLIVLVADHGEAFWEHGGWQHENYLYSEVLDIPLIVKPPGDSAVSASPGLAQQVDLLPTVLDQLQLPVPAAVQGRSLLETERGSVHRAGFAYLECPSGKRLAAVVAGPWKLIRTTAPDGSVAGVELYHRQRDPGETTNESATRPAEVHRLLALLEAAERAQPLDPTRVGIDGDLGQTLRALGYVN